MQSTDQESPRPHKSWREKMFHLFRVTTRPVLKVYHGYGHNNAFTLYGHLLKQSALPRKAYRQSILRNSLALIRLFLVKPLAGATIEMQWNGKKYYCESQSDGFFKFEWQDDAPHQKGWFPVEVAASYGSTTLAAATGLLYLSYSTQYVIISDIDDTFLISHSSNLKKRLLALFTQNARSRKPFDGVVRHYQLLSKAATTADLPNPFFYVSSSEWNLYDYILEFTRVNKIPAGIFLLSQLKRLSQVFRSGQNNHGTKFTRIVRIMQAFPNQKIILLGDSSQQDPGIYASVVQHYPTQVYAVYIRDVFKRNYQKVKEVLHTIEATGTHCCLFKESKDAIAHSVKIGLIAPVDADEKLTGTETEELKMA